MMALRLALRVALRLSAGLLLLSGGLLAVDSRPGPGLRDYPGFEACEPPCWAGVVVGQTQTQEVFGLIASGLPGMQTNYRTVMTQVGFTATGADSQLTGMIYDNRGVVDGLQLDLNVPLWNLIESLGTPGCVRSYPSPDGRLVVIVSWELEGYGVDASLLLSASARLQPADQTVVLAIVARASACTRPDERLWQGFAPVWYYRSG